MERTQSSIGTCLVAVEHRVAEADQVNDGREEAASGPLVAVVHVGSVDELVVLVAAVVPEKYL